MSKKNRKVAILGAGLAGLGIGFSLTQEETADIVILEKDNSIGGLCHTFKKNDCLLDYGPHFIHTHKKDILYFLKNVLKDDLKKYKSRVLIYFNKKFVKYPIKGLKVLKSLSHFKGILAIFSYLFARIRLFLTQPKNDNTFKDWITNRFGSVLYSIYFGPYAQKAWKIKDTEISAYVAKKRVPVITLVDYLRSLINLKAKTIHKEDPSQIDIYTPKYGSGQICDFFKHEIQKKNRILTNTKIKSINLSNNKFESITYTQDENEYTENFDFIFSTIPINDLILLLNPIPPKDIIHAAKSLDYCAEKILYLVINKQNILNAPLLYFQDPDIQFNRIYSFAEFGPDCIPKGKDVISIEFTCSVGDEIWNASDEKLFDETLNELEKIKLLNRKDVDSFFTKNISHAYPRFRLGFEKHLNTIFDYLKTIENGVSLGRQGLFCYANIDEILDMSFKASQFYHLLKWKGIKYKDIFKEYTHLKVKEN